MKTLTLFLFLTTVLCAQSTISGTVSLPILAPGTNGQRVVVMQQIGSYVPPTTTNIDAMGNYSFINVADGTYKLIPIVDGANVTPYNPIITVAGANQVINFQAVEAPASLNVFASTADLTYCVATKASTTKVQMKVQCRRAGIPRCSLDLITEDIDFRCGDLMWEVRNIPNGFHYQVWSWDKAADGSILGSHLASFGSVAWPAPAQKKQDKKKQIGFTVIQQMCVRCHNPAKPPNGLDLSTKESMLHGGKQGPALVPGKSDASLIYRAIQPDLGKVPPSGRMPPFQPLSPEQGKQIKEWIDSL